MRLLTRVYSMLSLTHLHTPPQLLPLSIVQATNAGVESLDIYPFSQPAQTFIMHMQGYKLATGDIQPSQLTHARKEFGMFALIYSPCFPSPIPM